VLRSRPEAGGIFARVMMEFREEDHNGHEREGECGECGRPPEIAKESHRRSLFTDVMRFLALAAFSFRMFLGECLPVLFLMRCEYPGSTAKGACVGECFQHGLANKFRPVLDPAKLLREVRVDLEGNDLFRHRYYLVILSRECKMSRRGYAGGP
jgi:hypothetical protein